MCFTWLHSFFEQISSEDDLNPGPHSTSTLPSYTNTHLPRVKRELK